jgi:hypothetical protein
MVSKRTADEPRITRSPAMTYALMIGEEPTARVHGWVALAQAGLYGEPTVEAVWAQAQHRAAVIAEAAAHGFKPHALTGRTPRGAGVERWRKAFLAAHVY